MSKRELVDRLIEYDHYYHTVGEPLVSDAEYDDLKDRLRELDPKNSYFKRVGADDDNSVELPFYMGSLDKIKDTPDVLTRWISKYTGDYMVSDKLDGISALIYIKNKQIKMYTRGNGTNGRDITHVLKDIKGVPDLKSINEDTMAVRGELIIPKADWREEYGSNARNVVAGVINAKIVKKNVLSIIRFVAYDVVYPRLKINEAYKKMQELGFETAFHRIEKQLSIDILLNILRGRKQASPYEIDGIVIIDNGKKHPLKEGQNPKYGFAFKSLHTHEQIEVNVKEVEWNISKDGYLKPRVLIDPIQLDGVTISAATAYNAQYVSSNRIGKDARILIIRSGGVIPKIQEIISPAPNGPDMPKIPYEWNDTHVDIYSKDDNNQEQRLKELEHFMTSLEIEKVAKGTIKKLFDAGYTTIPKLLNMTRDDVKAIQGFNDKSADTIVSSISTIRKKPIPMLMAASNVFGRGMGVKKLNMIYDLYMDRLIPYLKGNGEDICITKEDMRSANGIGDVTAASFIENLPRFHRFYSEMGIEQPNEVTKKPTNVGNSMIGMIVVFTGFRDAGIAQYIEENGGTIASSVSKNTSLVIAKDPTKITGSVKKANDLGIQVMSRDEFMHAYSLS